MTWTPECKIPIIYRPEDIEQMEIQVELLKELEERPERFSVLFQPRFSHWPWFSMVYDKILKLVKKEAIKECAKIERTLQYAKEQQHSQDPTYLYWKGVVDDSLDANHPQQSGGHP